MTNNKCPSTPSTPLLTGSPTWRRAWSTTWSSIWSPGILLIFRLTVVMFFSRGPTLLAGATSFDCPTACFCNVLSRIVYCSRRGLPSIPGGISSDSLQLNLNANAFVSTVLRRSNFTGYDRLGHLYLSECGLEDIEVGAFADLTALKWLDLSNNRLRTIPEHAFRGLNLQHLFLNGNRQLHLLPGSFAGLATIGLYLHDCSLVDIQPEVLEPINSTLRYLWLNGNEMAGVGQKLQTLFYMLVHLRLGSNPLHCNCELMWLKEFYDRHGDIFKGAVPPSCLSPNRLKGKQFNQISLFEFSCRPPTFADIEVSLSASSARLKCTATGDPVPAIYWIQPSGKTTKYSSRNDDDIGMVAIKRNEGILTVQTASGQTVGGGGWPGGSGAGQKIGGAGVGGGAGQKTGGLVGMYICIANNDAGNVTLTVNVSLAGTKIIGPEVAEIGGHQMVDIVSSSLTTVRLSAGRDDDREMDDINDQVVNSDRTTSLSKKFPTPIGKNNSSSTLGGSILNRTHVVVKEGERLFTVLEFVCAILGTHICTLVVCLLTVSKLYQCKVKPGTSVDKPLPNGFTNDAPDKNDPVSILPTQSVYINNQGRHFIVPDYTKTSAFVAK